MKRLSVFSFLFLLVLSAGAQTKLIFHKSHSGSERTFRMALDMNDADLDGSDFGMAPERTVKTAALDSLIFVSDSVTIMVTSERCSRDRGSRPAIITKWTEGKDTLYNHPLFNRKNGIAFIKNELKRYYFQNPIDSVKFVEYITEDSLQYQVPLASTNQGGTGGGGNNNTPVIWLGLILLLSFFVTGAYWLLRKYGKPSFLPQAQ